MMEGSASRRWTPIHAEVPDEDVRSVLAQQLGRALAAAWRRWAVRAGLLVSLYGYLAYRFCRVYFPLDPGKVGGPGDFEPYSAMDWIVAKTLAEHHELPLWN